MKVIKRSPRSGTKTKRFECDHCEAVLEVGGKDLVFRADERDGNAYVFKCPECGEENWVAAPLIPPAMRDSARR